MIIEEENLPLQQFGEAVTRIRSEKGLSIRKLALLAEMEHHQIINIEKGRVDIRLSTLLKLAKALEVPPGKLLTSLD